MPVYTAMLNQLPNYKHHLTFCLSLRQAMTCMVFSMVCMSMLAPTTAQAASCKIPKSYYKHVSCTNDARYFLAVKDSGSPVALIDKNGKKVVDLSRYQKVATDKISEGLLPVQRSNKVGYLNMKGREVVPAVYDVLVNEVGSSGWARPVAEGRIVVKKADKYGVITTANKVIVPFSSSITAISNYQGGRIQVTKGSQGVIWLDKQGKVSKTAPTTKPTAIQKTVPKTAPSTNTAPVNNPLTKGSKATASTTSSLPFTTLYPQQKNGKWGFVDERDVTMITYSFDEVMPFSEGLAGVRIANNWGFVNLGGELVIPFRFDDTGVIKSQRYQGTQAFMFNNGKAWIGNLKNGDKLCIDSNGTNVSCD